MVIPVLRPMRRRVKIKPIPDRYSDLFIYFVGVTAGGFCEFCC